MLLDSANLCNPTVLDRLNPMLEPGGQLYLNECGTVDGQPRVIQPHPDFRLFLALDPRYCLVLPMLCQNSANAVVCNLLLRVMCVGSAHKTMMAKEGRLQKFIGFIVVC